MNYTCNYPQVVRDAGFKLRIYKDGPLDWRLMGSYETERILREQNFELVDFALQHLSEAPLGSLLETNILDAGIAKYFLMSQFSIQYLRFCRKFLDETVCELRDENTAAQMEIAKLKKSLNESNAEIVQLNKKITQIEAIREVVYPCHLCTKNFISNEALNIHISRKHHTRHTHSSIIPETASIQLGIKEAKDTDVTLINTIKMELEIKQLKERLNAAEKNIQSGTTATTCHAAILNQREIGIQSNLVETKEKNDEDDVDDVEEISHTHSKSVEQKEQIQQLQNRVNDFANQQKNLIHNNEEINEKLENIILALNNFKQNLELSKKPHKNDVVDVEQKQLQSPTSMDVLKNIERTLTEKFNEINKENFQKLDKTVQHLEAAYTSKLDALENELARIEIAKVTQKTETVDTNVSHGIIEIQTNKTTNSDDADTYSIEADKPQMKTKMRPEINENNIQINNKDLLLKSTVNEAPTPPPPPVIQNVKTVILNDSTDISESFDDDTESFNENIVAVQQQQQTDLEADKKSTENNTKVQNNKKSKNRTPAIPTQHIYTAKDAKILANKRLNAFGFDMKSKQISSSTLKRACSELAERRTNLKLKYPNYYITRQRIRKFVDKLCTAKLPDSAESLLKHKTPLKPKGTISKTQKQTEISTTTTDDGDDEHLAVESHNTKRADEQTEFKNRLETLLMSSQMPKSMTRLGQQTQQHLSSTPLLHKPVPRKRVMFKSSETLENINND